MGFQVLECQANIENRFGTGADHSHIGVSQFLQVGRNVQCGLGASVDTTDAARRKDPDTSQIGDDHGGSDGCGSVQAFGQDEGDVAAAGLDDIVAGTEVFDFFPGQSDLELAFDDGDGRRDCAIVTDNLFHRQGSLDVFRIGHAMGDDC